MKLSRESSLLIGIPVALVAAGVWWIATDDSHHREAPGTGFQFDAARASETTAPPIAKRGNVAPRIEAAEGPPRAAGLDVATIARVMADATKPSAIWSGVVRSRSGDPIEGAVVVVRIARGVRLGDDSSIADEKLITLTTGADGLVALEFLAGLQLEVEVRAPGFGVERFSLDDGLGQELVLDRASAVEGRVLMDGSGAPMADARVIFENALERYEIVTDHEGRFRFDGVGARAARIQVADGRFVAAARSVGGLQAGVAQLLGDILVAAGSPLAGEVVDGAHGAVPGATVTLIDRVSRQEVASTIADSFGRFSFHAINPARQYAVVATGPGYRSDVFANGDGFVSLRVSPTWTLGIALSAGGAPAAEALAILKRHDGLPFAGSDAAVVGKANAQGLVAFGSLSRDVAYRVVIAKAGYATMDLGPLTAAWNEEQPLVLGMIPGSTVAGTVVDGSGQPVGGVTVRAQRADAFPGPPLFVTADSEGQFEFQSVIAPGTISLVTFKPGYDNAREVVAVPSGVTSVPLVVHSLSVVVDVP